MITLLLDTSDSGLAVGLARDHKLVGSIEYEAWQKQSELLMAEIDHLLNRYHLTRHDIGGVVASRGPGSYTGVRIALTVAKVMAFALSVPLYLVSSLEIEKDLQKPSICLRNAHSKRSYIGVYQGEQKLLPDQVMENEAVLRYIQEHSNYVVMGNVQYLGLKGNPVDVLMNLAASDVVSNLVPDVLKARPVYLKDY